jgi:metal-dependent amidase/aminoacylase/carboxypeptidase family protein
VLAAIHRIADAEAVASGAPAAPEYAHEAAFHALVNDPAASERTRAVLARTLEEQRDRIETAGGRPAVISLPPLPGSEDVGDLARAVDVPLVYWNLGGFETSLFADFDLSRATGMGNLPDGVAPNHSPYFAPAPEPTLDLGVALLVAAAREWLA